METNKKKKGNPATLKSYKKGEQRTIENASKGGKKKKENADKRRSLREALEVMLYAVSPKDGSKVMMDDWLEAVLKKMVENPDTKDIKIVAEVLGELQQKMKVEADVNAEVSGKLELFQLPVEDDE